MSHAPIPQHRSASHNPMHSSSPKRSSHYPPPSHGAGPPGEVFHPSSRIYQGRRRSDEESFDQRKFSEQISEQCRLSADPLVAHHDHSPRVYRSHHSQSFKHDHPQSTTAACKFVEGEELEAGSSQQWGEPAITITLEEEDKSKSSSSGSTLIESGSPKETRKSQEAFGDEDSKEMMSLVPDPAPIPLSNFPHYYESSSYFGEHQESYPASTSKHDQIAPLSQPTYPSPPKTRHGKSLTDLTGSNISLTSSQQFLSQSAVDFQQLHHSSARHVGSGETRRMRFRQQMSSDPHLSKPHPPGLQMSMISALSNVSEGEEQRRQAKAKRSLSQSTGSQREPRSMLRVQQKSSQPQQRHLKAAVVRTSEEMKQPSNSPRNKRYNYYI